VRPQITSIVTKVNITEGQIVKKGDLLFTLDDRTDKDGNPMFVQVYDEATKSMVDSTERLITKGLKSNHIAQVKHNTNMTLAQTDWYVIRKAERNIAIPADVAADRAAIVAWATATEASITAVTTVEELKAINLGVSI
jgi:multidrug resistance efflux pump